MNILRMLQSLALSAVFSGAASSCSVYKSQLSGPDAFSYWASENAKSQGCPGVRTRAESLRIKQDLTNKLQQYIASHPEVTEPKKKQLQELTVRTGMTKEEVQFLLAAPLEILKSPETLAGMARDEWKDTDEAWIYRVGDASCSYYYTYVLYFRADTITRIVKIVPPIWWL